MNAAPQLLQAELLKIRTSRTTWLLLGAMVVVILAIVGLTLGSRDADELEGARGVRTVLTIGGGVACFFTLALGVVGMAGEYRHATVGHTLLAAPERWPLVVAKAIAYAAAGLLFGLVALAATFALGLPGLAAQDAGVSSSSALLRTAVLGTLLSGAVFAVIGVGLAAVLRDQVLALSVGLGWMAVVDTLALSLAPGVGKFFPGGALAGLLRSQSQDVLAVGLAAVLLLVYALALAAAGAFLVRGRDVT